MQRHLLTCTACSTELTRIREISAAFDHIKAERMSVAAMARAHATADASAASASPLPFLRVAGVLAGLAASILIIASAWLWDSSADVSESSTVSVPLSVTAAPEWERIAMTLDTGPLIRDTSGTPDQQILASAGGNDARVAEWMVQNLSR